MIEFYPQIRHVHILTVVLSGSLFALRGLFALAGARWPPVAPVRYLRYTIDTTLLTAALLLVSTLPRAMFANGGLAARLGIGRASGREKVGTDVYAWVVGVLLQK